MKRSNLIILLLLLVVLATAYFLQDSDEIEDTTYAVPSERYFLDPQRIVRIDISRVQGFVRLERVRGEWKVTEPLFATADPEKVRMLQDGMAAFRLTGLVSSNPDRQQIFEVDDQGTNVAFVNDDGKSIALIVGKSAPTPGAAFVRTPLSDTVYLAQGLTQSLLNWDLRDWRQRVIYAVPGDSLTAFNIKNGSRTFSLRREGSEWLSRTGRIPQETVNPILFALSRVQAEAFVDTPMMIKNRPKYEIEISGSRPMRMELYSLTPSDTNFLLKTSVSSTVVVIRPALAKGLNELVERLTPRQEPAPVVEKRPPAVPQRPPQTSTVPPRQVVPQSTTPTQQTPTTGRQRRATRKATQQQQTQRPADDDGDLTVHTVKRGESINTIAKKYDVTVDQIRRWNGLQNDVVVTGMEVYVFVKRK
ncbi:MAG: DUF4340 domain-containing protein [Bacteroidota bacterium]